MGRRVKDGGGSERRSVMERIGVYAPRASGLTSLWCLITRESDKPTEEAKQMTAMQVAGAASRCKARRQQRGIVKVEWQRPTGFCKGPWEMLELLEGKLSRAVLRGLGGSNPIWLPGGRLGNRRPYPAPHRGPVAVLHKPEGHGWAARGARER